jgi:hypothetical protein
MNRHKQFYCGLKVILVLSLFGSNSFQSSIAWSKQTDIADKAMELSGLSASETFEVDDGLPIMPEDPILKRLLYRIGKTSAGNLNQWARYAADVDWKSLAEQPRGFRFWVFHRTGKVKTVIPFRYSEDSDDDLLKGFYVAYCESGSGDPFVVITRSTCVSWPLDEVFESPQSIAFSGFFYAQIELEDERLKLELRSKSEVEQADNVDSDDATTEADGNAVPVFIANRLAWYPDSVQTSLGVDESRVALAKAGVDIGQFDYVRKENSKPLGSRDSDCFFQMLGAVKSLGAGVPEHKTSFVGLMNEPIESIGKAVSIEGRVRQCVPVKIQSDDTKQATGLDGYFQVTLFPDLDGQKIVVSNPNGEDQVFRRFPVTVCLTELPDGLTPAEMEGKQIALQGFFYRFWSYVSERANQDGVAGQVSPLVIASQTKVFASSQGQLNLFLGGLLFAMIVGMCLLGWYYSYQRHRGSDRTDAIPQDELPEKLDTSNFDLAD